MIERLEAADLAAYTAMGLPALKIECKKRNLVVGGNKEQIAKRLPGVGFATAKKIVELRMSLSGERFANLKQLENIPRVNWDQLISDDLIFIS